MTVHKRLEPGKYRLDTDDYACLGDAGVFGDAHTELIGGEIIVMSPEWRPHMRVKDELAYRLRRALEELGSSLFVGTGGSVAITAHDMPRPDIILTSEADGEGAVPIASVVLLVEVSSSTLGFDIGDKPVLYAAAGVPEYWVADVNGRVIHRMWSPDQGAYTRQDRIDFGRPISSATIAGLTIGTHDL